MKRRVLFGAMVVLGLLVALPSVAATVTGNPLADGWTYNGHSLENGVYVRGSANYGYDVYTTVFTVTDSSDFSLSGHDDAAYAAYAYSWDASTAADWAVGDTIVGIGGVFTGITAGDAGWAAFTGGAVNNLLSNQLKLQAKFATDDATWSTSTIAPNAGDGTGSLSLADPGAIQVRSSAYLGSGWATYADQIMGIQKPSHLTVNGGYDYGDVDLVNAVRLIWTYDQNVASWQILLNTSMLNGPIGPGSQILATVQNGDNAYTDALALTTSTVVPEPATMTLLGLGLSGVVLSRIRRKQS